MEARPNHTDYCVMGEIERRPMAHWPSGSWIRVTIDELARLGLAAVTLDWAGREVYSLSDAGRNKLAALRASAPPSLLRLRG